MKFRRIPAIVPDGAPAEVLAALRWIYSPDKEALGDVAQEVSLD